MKRLLLYFLVFLQIIAVNATTYTVDDDGGADFTTIQSAIDSASSGDTVFVKAGIYSESITINKYISLLGVGYDSTTIVAQNNCVAVSIFEGGMIRGFTITSDDSLNSDGIFINVRSKIEIVNNKLVKLKNGIIIPDSPIWGSKYYLSSCTQDTCYIKIFGNIITCNKTGIYLDGCYLSGEIFDDTVTYDAVENWWGTVDSLEIKKGIFDWAPRKVDYNNWLLEEVNNPTGAQHNGIHQNNIYWNSEWNVFVAHDPTSVRREDINSPQKFALYQNYPNPFNPVTTIQYYVPTQNHCTLRIYNVLGQEVTTLLDEMKTPGSYSITWEAENEPSGIYFYRLQAGDYSETKKILLIR
ncbi:MAG: T9SS type A sorting domain-containing protein [Candidatus Neomarinimicrobiota bacterium]